MSSRFRIAILAMILLASVSLSGLTYARQPYRAMLYSALLPGGGQLYNDAYVKAGLVAGLQGYLIYTAVDDNRLARHYDNLATQTTDPAIRAFYISKRDVFRSQARSDNWWIGGVLLLSVADAFVDAHLFNFKADKQKVHLKFGDKALQLQYEF